MSETTIGTNVGGAAKREIGSRLGPYFFEGADGRVMFQFGIDASSVVGPYAAKESDRHDHQGAWFRFCDENPAYNLRTGKRSEPVEVVTINLPQLDHDGDGKPGGSLPEAEMSEADEKEAIREKLLELGAGLPHPRTGLTKLRAALAEALADQ